jgi:hypothetical protein
MEGMKSENSGHKDAFPDFSGHAAKKPEEQKSAQDMQDKICQMITAGIETMKLIIKQER